ERRRQDDALQPDRERARDQVEERRLAGAVRADEPGDGARVDREIDAVDRAQIPEGLDEPEHLEHDARLWQSPRSNRLGGLLWCRGSRVVRLARVEPGDAQALTN